VGDDEFNAQFKDEIAALARAVTVYVSSDEQDSIFLRLLLTNAIPSFRNFL